MVHRAAIQKMVAFVGKKRFDKAWNKVKVVSAGNGKCGLEMLLEEEHVNSLGALHNGLSGALIDVASYYAFITHPKLIQGQNASPEMFPMCTIESYMSYTGSAKVGEQILIEANTVKKRGPIGFIEISIVNKATSDVLVKGQQQYMNMSQKPLQGWKTC